MFQPSYLPSVVAAVISSRISLQTVFQRSYLFLAISRKIIPISILWSCGLRQRRCRHYTILTLDQILILYPFQLSFTTHPSPPILSSEDHPLLCKSLLIPKFIAILFPHLLTRYYFRKKSLKREVVLWLFSQLKI